MPIIKKAGVRQLYITLKPKVLKHLRGSKPKKKVKMTSKFRVTDNKYLPDTRCNAYAKQWKTSSSCALQHPDPLHPKKLHCSPSPFLELGTGSEKKLRDDLARKLTVLMKKTITKTTKAMNQY